MSTVPANVSALVLSFCASSCLLAKFIPWMSCRILDYPNSRSSHVAPIPRGGGVFFVVITSIFALFLFATHSTVLNWLPLIALPLAAVGLADDLFDLPPPLRLFAQLLTSVVLVLLSPLTNSLYLATFFVLCSMSCINFTNFMDGADGLIASCFSVAFIAAAIKLNASFPSWILIGSLLGFLFWNWGHAKVFMGDVGSTFLGALFAGYVLQATSLSESLGLLLVLFPVFADAFVTLIRRLLAGQPVFRAHRQHLFQRLNDAGWSHRRVATVYLLSTSLLALTIMYANLHLLIIFSLTQLFLGLWLDRYVANPFAS